MAIWRGAGGPGDATTDAANQASVASNKATEAASSAAAAAASASSAATSATNSSNSATTAASSASAAASSASSASSSASAASSSASAAASSASAAQTAETNAETAETNAETAQAAAEAAQAAAEAAQAAAETAETNAETAETNAETAATNAVASASTASTAATNASNSASAAATSASNAATSATNASNSATAAASSASAASTSETNAASSASAASTSASNAATSATNASNSATAAASSASAASSSASSAASSASAASASADAALSALDNFDDRYLGQKTADPTLDNDGNALVTGALYFNTTDGVMKVYDGSLWLAAYASLSGALIAASNLSDLVSVSSARTNLGLGTGDSPSFAGLTVDTNTLYVDAANNRVGIGTASPSYALDVDGEMRIKTNTNGLIMQTSTSSNVSVLRITGGNNVVLRDSTNSDALTIDSSGRVGIGTSSPESQLHVTSASGSNSQIRIITGDTSSTSQLIFGDSADSNVGGVQYAHSDNSLQFHVGNIGEKVRIDSSGKLLVGKTSSDYTTAGFEVNPAGLVYITRNNATLGLNRTSTDGAMQYFYKDGTTVGSIGVASGGIYFGSGSSGTERVRIDSSGNVGIGDSAPSEKLNVAGNVMLEGGDQYLYLTNVGTGNSGIYIRGNTAGTYLRSHTTGTFTWEVTGSEKMRIDSAGNVGIGTSSPNRLLDIATTTAAGSTLVSLTSATDGNCQLLFGDTASDTQGKVLYNNSGDYMAFHANGYEAMRINNSNYVGIGTSSPSANLHVQGNSAVIKLLESGGSEMRMAVTGSASYLGTYVGDPLVFTTNSTERMRISAAGNVGIGTTSPAQLLSLSSTSPRIILTHTTASSNAYVDAATSGVLEFSADDNNVAASSSMRFKVDGSERMRIDSSGRVGIGTSSPADLLQVSFSNNNGATVGLQVHNTNTGTTANYAGLYTTAVNGTVGMRLNACQSTSLSARVQVGSTTAHPVSFVTSDTERARISAAGGLSVGTAADPGAGAIYATGNITAYYSSDARLKENIKDVDNALDKVCAIGSKTFDWTDEYIESKGGEDGYFVQKSDFGVVAQDVQAVFPQAVRTREDGTLAVDYEKLATLAFGAIKELVKRVEALEAK